MYHWSSVYRRLISVRSWVQFLNAAKNFWFYTYAFFVFLTFIFFNFGKELTCIICIFAGYDLLHDFALVANIRPKIFIYKVKMYPHHHENPLTVVILAKICEKIYFEYLSITYFLNSLLNIWSDLMFLIWSETSHCPFKV